MASNNNFKIIGTLYRDPLAYPCSNGSTKYLLPMLVERPVKRDAEGKRPVDFVNIVYWAYPKGFDAAASLTKGSRIKVSGRLESSCYEKDGKTVYRFDTVAKAITYLSPKKEKDTAPAQTPVPVPAQVSAPAQEEPVDIYEDELYEGEFYEDDFVEEAYVA